MRTMRNSDSESRRRVGSCIRRARDDRNIKQKDLAACIGKSAPWLSHVESGKIHLGAEDLRVIASSLQMTVGELLEEVSAPTPPFTADSECLRYCQQNPVMFRMVAEVLKEGGRYAEDKLRDWLTVIRAAAQTVNRGK